MGTITLTNTDSESIEYNYWLLAVFGGATAEESGEGEYDPITEIYSNAFVSDSELATALGNFSTLYADWKIANGITPTTLDTYKSQAKSDIDNYAGTTRLKFITAVPGQEITYAEKSDEATDFVAAGYPADLGNYPFVAAEVAATGLTPTEAADGILAQKSAWIAIGAKIEEFRIGGKKQIDAAVTESELAGIVDSTKLLLDTVGT